MKHPTDKRAADSHTDVSDDGLELWLHQAFHQADEDLPAGDFSRRVELAVDRQNRLARLLVLASAVTLAAALSLLVISSNTGSLAVLIDLFGQFSQSTVTATNGLAGLSDLAASNVAATEYELPATGSLQGLVSLLIMALVVSWLTERAAG